VSAKIVSGGGKVNVNSRRDERNQEVLTHIVRIYINSDAPVSSQSVVERMGDSVSSATIRNIMAELEEAGYITQPHTSAGRMPTDTGYRKYVELVKDRLKTEKKRAEALGREYDERIRTVRDIIEKTSSLISRELHQTSVAMMPPVDSFSLRRLELVKVQAETVLAVLVTMTNDVKNYIIRINRDIEKAELEKISNYINANCEELNLIDVHARIKELACHGDRREILEVANSALEIIDMLLDDDAIDKVFYDGIENFAGMVNHADIDVARRMLQMFTDRSVISRLLRDELPYSGVRVYIGKENRSDILKECSIITSGYGYRGKTIGRIGVIGATRMDYDRVMWTVKYLSEVISVKLEEIGR
jgi:heat-inducible transcriptional repressor